MKENIIKNNSKIVDTLSIALLILVLGLLGNSIYTLNTDNRLFSAVISPNIELIASGGTAGFALYSVPKEKIIYRDRNIYPHPNSFSFSPDSSMLAIGLWGSKIGLLNLQNLNDYYELSEHSKPVDSLDFTQDGKYLVSGSTDTLIKVWDIENRKAVLSFFAHEGYSGVESVKVSPDNMLIASAAVRLESKENEIKLWELKTGKLVAHIINPEFCYVRNISFSPNGQHLAAVLSNSLVKIWDISEVSKPILISECTTENCSSLPSSKIEDRTGGAPSNDGGPGSIEKIIFSPNSNSIFGCGYGAIYYWESFFKSKSLRLNEHKFDVWDIRFVSDSNKHFLSIGEDGVGRFWEKETLQSHKAFSGLKASNFVEWKILLLLSVTWAVFWYKSVITPRKRHIITSMTALFSLANGLIFYDLLCNMSGFDSYQIIQLFLLGSIVMLVLSLFATITFYKNKFAYSFAQACTIVLTPILLFGMNFYIFFLIVATV